jgi:sec-independent protein translocase protein TatA
MLRNPTTDLIVILVIVLLIWGPKRLPGLGRQLGQGLREFKDSITGDAPEETERPELTRSTAAPSPESRPSTANVVAPAPTSTQAPAPQSTPASASGSAEGGSERRA